MKRSRIAAPLGIILAASLVITTNTGAADTPPVGSGADVQVTTEFVDPANGVVVVEVPEETGVEGTTEVAVVGRVPESVVVDAVDDRGKPIGDSLAVESITVIDSENFIATVRSETTGEIAVIDTTQAEQQIIPVIVVALVKVGIKAALKHGSKAAIQSAAKKQIIALSSHKWKHIMASKHNWKRLAKSKSQVADFMSRALTNGKRTPSAKGHIDFIWKYGNHTIVVRTSKSGHISNGWIR